MSDLLRFQVPGEPVPKGRARTRVVRTKAGKSFAQHYTPAETAAYEAKVKLLCQVTVARQRWTWNDKDRFALGVTIFRTHEGRGGDCDNYIKIVSDAINGVAFPDDRYVRRIASRLSQDAKNPRVMVVVKRMRIGETS